MSSAVRLILGVSIWAMTAGCDNGSSDSGGPLAVNGGNGSGAAIGSTAGATSGGGANGAGASGAGASNAGTSNAGTSNAGTSNAGGGVLPEGVPLTPADGWVDGASNTLGIQGAMFAYADDTSKMGLVEDFAGMKACIKGTAAKVDLKCTPVAPATDCYGTFWGAAIGLNLNQAIDPATLMGAAPAPFDASALKGFAFEVSGAAVPTSLRFKVENSAGEFCNPSLKPVLAGANTFLFSDLLSACWKVGGMSAEGGKSSLLKIAWQVVTKDNATVPFDYCVSNVRALK